MIDPGAADPAAAEERCEIRRIVSTSGSSGTMTR